MTLEKLLNTLCEKGRVPFGDEKISSFEIIYVTGKIRNIVAKRGRGQLNMHYSIIELCSKSSGLWQFVCENKLIPYDEDGYTWYERTKDYIDDFENSNCKMLDLEIDNGYEYRLIESALKDESELEEFLLENIQIGN